MSRLATLARSVFAVAAGIATITIVAFALETPLWWLVKRLFSARFPDPATLHSHPLWMLSQFLYTVPGAIAGGYVTARLAPGHGLAHAVATAIVEDLLIIALVMNSTYPIPAWMWFLGLSITPAAIIFGGYLHTRRKTEPTSISKNSAVWPG